MKTIKAIWKNEQGNEIPEWLGTEVRSTGGSKKHIFVGDKNKRTHVIPPNTTVHLLEDETGKRMIGIK